MSRITINLTEKEEQLKTRLGQLRATNEYKYVNSESQIAKIMLEKGIERAEEEVKIATGRVRSRMDSKQEVGG